MKVLGTRPLLMVGIAVVIVAGSILVAPAAAPAPGPPEALADPAGMVGAGVLTRPGYADRVIAQMRVRLDGAAPDAALAQLGLAYLQKARETNDPTYYAQAEMRSRARWR